MKDVRVKFKIEGSEVKVRAITHSTGFHFLTVRVNDQLVAFNFRLNEGEKASSFIEAEGDWFELIQSWLNGEQDWESAVVS